jgi:hypothetical protein
MGPTSYQPGVGQYRPTGTEAGLVEPGARLWGCSRAADGGLSASAGVTLAHAVNRAAE